eukprot:TRINITY_DN19722_c0_g1_i4.p1 TRINITY_DN19722_c0_g1~~TRINITY_DN19722_c0_g1_i4.p1  ORF type:complete len:328 (+),score=68.47 TRINITY_DN19722_c0_g1_i4:180-1163(+)
MCIRDSINAEYGESTRANMASTVTKKAKTDAKAESRAFAALLEAAIESRDRFGEYEEALAWCRAHGKRGHAALATGNWLKISWKGVNDRLDGLVENGMEHADKRLLTQREEEQLAAWIEDCNRAGLGRNRQETRAQVRHILQLRRAANRRGGRKVVSLSAVAQRLLANPQLDLPDDGWFRRFYASHPQVAEKKPQKCEKSRAAAHSEATIQDHFFGQAGVEQELIAAGIMDPETRLIVPGLEKRLINRDETPQFFDYNDSKGGGQARVGAGVRDAAVQAATESRCDVTVLSLIHISEPTRLLSISYAVFCLKKKKNKSLIQIRDGLI